MILSQASLYTFSLLRGAPSNYCPWAAMHLSQWCCHHWKCFWNSCCGI